MRANRKKGRNLINVASYAMAIAIWLVIWHIAAIGIDNEIFLPTPEKVLEVLICELIPAKEFWSSLLASVFRIAIGFIIGSVLGVILAVLSYVCIAIKIFLWFPIKVIKSVPVASFVILTLLWVDSEQLAIVIPAMIVLPTLYINTLSGIEQRDVKLLEMANVFNVPIHRKLINIYIPGVIPYVLSASSLAVGMAWKSGIAAEIIGLAKSCSSSNSLFFSSVSCFAIFWESANRPKLSSKSTSFLLQAFK